MIMEIITKDTHDGKNLRALTHNIKQLGFNGLRGFGSRSCILVGGQVLSPKTQPFHIVKRCCDTKSY